MAKTICFSKIQLCATSHNCIFWVLDNFYCHKNFMCSYYTLYTIFYNSFYVPNIIQILVLISFYSLWLKLKKTGLDWFQLVVVPVFWYFRIRQPVVVAGCLFLGQKPDRTRPANTTLGPPLPMFCVLDAWPAIQELQFTPGHSIIDCWSHPGIHWGSLRFLLIVGSSFQALLPSMSDDPGS